MIKLFFLIFFIYINSATYAKVDPPNYDFSINTLQAFLPGQNIENVKTKFKNSILLSTKNQITTYKFYIEHVRYRFPVIVQVANGVVLDFFARLPNYFLHDIFHQSLINQIGNQNQYLKKDSHAVYIWNNINGHKHVYAGACTITCFPQYYSVISVNPQSFKFIPLIDLLKNQVNLF